jgi:hypothetical protein|tara:strand:+ start:218 stop:436 length:219 start_codon:yes stop_codon:yes gene_type:complete
MSSQTHSQGSPSEEIEWDLEELKKAITDSADEYDKLLDKAGQEALPSGTAEAMWEMERQMWAQRQGKDESSF